MSDRHLGMCHKEMWGGYCDCSPRKRKRRKLKPWKPSRRAIEKAVVSYLSLKLGAGGPHYFARDTIKRMRRALIAAAKTDGIGDK